MTSLVYRAAPPVAVPTAKLGAIGDSLTAGMAYAMLSGPQQDQGYVSQFAQQLGVTFWLPRMVPPLLPFAAGRVVASATLPAVGRLSFNILPPQRGTVQGGRAGQIPVSNAKVQNYETVARKWSSSKVVAGVLRCYVVPRCGEPSHVTWSLHT